MPDTQLTKIRDTLREFAAARDWDQFHSPKNLAMALSVEASELLEHFQWLTEEESRAVSGDKLTAVKHELADVLIYLVRLADKLDVDLMKAVDEKLVLNANKYPVEKSKGKVTKYDKL